MMSDQLIQSDDDQDSFNVGLNVEVENPREAGDENVIIKLDTGLEFHSYIKPERRSSSEETTSDGRLGSAEKRKQNRPTKRPKNVLENFVEMEDIKDPTLLRAFTKNASKDPVCGMKDINSQSNFPKPKQHNWGSRLLKRAQPYGMPFDASTSSSHTADTSLKEESGQHTVSLNNPYHTNYERNSFQLNNNISSDHLIFSNLSRTCVQRYRQMKDAASNERDLKKIRARNSAKVQNPSSIPKKDCVRLLQRKRPTPTSGHYKRKSLESAVSRNRGRPPARGRFPTRGRPPLRGRPPIRSRFPTRGRPSLRGRPPLKGRPPTRNVFPSRGRPPLRGRPPTRGRPPNRGRRPTISKPPTPFQKPQPSSGFLVLKDRMELSPKQNSNLQNLQNTDADTNQPSTSEMFHCKQEKENESDGRDCVENPSGISSKSRFANVENSDEMNRNYVGLNAREAQEQLRRQTVTKKYQLNECFCYSGRRKERRSYNTYPAQTSFKDITADDEQLQHVLVKAKRSNDNILNPTHSSPMLSGKSQESQNQSSVQQKKLPHERSRTLQKNDDYKACSTGIRCNREQKDDEFSHFLLNKNSYETNKHLDENEDLTELNGDTTGKSENRRQLDYISFTNTSRGRTYIHPHPHSDKNLNDYNAMVYDPEQRRTDLFNSLQNKYRHKNSKKLDKDGNITYMDEDNTEKFAISTQPEYTFKVNKRRQSPYRATTPQSSSNTDDSGEIFSSERYNPEKKKADLSHFLQNKNHYKTTVKLEEDGDIMELNEDNAGSFILRRKAGYILCTNMRPLYKINGNSCTYPSSGSNADDSESILSSMSSNLEENNPELLHLWQSENPNKITEALNEDMAVAEPNKDNVEKWGNQRQTGFISCTSETNEKRRTCPRNDNTEVFGAAFSPMNNNLKENNSEISHLFQSKNFYKTAGKLNEDRNRILDLNEGNGEKTRIQEACTSNRRGRPHTNGLNMDDYETSFRDINYNQNESEFTSFFPKKELCESGNSEIPQAKHIAATSSRARGRPRIFPHYTNRHIDDYQEVSSGASYSPFLKKELDTNEKSGISKQPENVSFGRKRRGRPRKYPQTDRNDRVSVTQRTREVSTRISNIHNTLHCVCRIKKTREVSTQTNLHIEYFA